MIWFAFVLISLITTTPIEARGAGSQRPVVCIDDTDGLFAIPRRRSDDGKGGCPKRTKEWRGAGVNIFDSWWVTSSAMGKQIDLNETIHSFDMAKNYANISFFRFFASPYGVHKSYWVENEQQYWDEMDIFFDVVEQSGLYVIPSIGYHNWHVTANAITPGLKETMNDFVRNSNSKSQRLCKKYFTDFVRRYHKRKSILLWELGNELNLLVNLPPPWCDEKDHCFNTKDMVKLTKKLVRKITKIDNSRPISSGFASPRPSAWHQEHCRSSSRRFLSSTVHGDGLQTIIGQEENVVSRKSLPQSMQHQRLPSPFSSADGEEKCCNLLKYLPKSMHPEKPLSSWTNHEWELLEQLCPHGGCTTSSIVDSSRIVVDPKIDSCASGYWGTDTKEQWSKQLKKQNKAVDVWSLHQYDEPQTCYFDRNNCTRDATIMMTASTVALKEDAMLYVGEYGGPIPAFTGPTQADQKLPSQMLDIQISDAEAGGAFVLSSIWAWMCPLHRKEMVCIWPGSTIPKERGSDRMIEIIQNANEKLMKK